MKENVVSTPTRERCVTSYAARTQYRPGEIHPPHVKVKDAIDIHCHAHEGQQNAFDLAKRASQAEMKGLLFKSIVGVDPQLMYNAIREVGPEHFTLSSDAGEPLFPDSVESMRLVRGYMEAFGLTPDELYTVCTGNPAKVVGLKLN